MSTPLIQISNLEFSYTTSPFLRIPEFNLNAGESVFVEGPSGVGKTTWLEILSGILKSQRGEYQFAGRRVDQMSDAERDQLRLEGISFIFQSHNLVSYLTVMENLLLPFWLGAKFPISEKETLDKARAYLNKLGLAGTETTPVSQLSQGQSQRVAAIRSFLKKPKLILADEPTSSLDFKTRDEFMSLLKDLCAEEKMALVFVSHDPSLKTFFSRVVALKEWRL